MIANNFVTDAIRVLVSRRDGGSFVRWESQGSGYGLHH